MPPASHRVSRPPRARAVPARPAAALTVVRLLAAATIHAFVRWQLGHPGVQPAPR